MLAACVPPPVSGDVDAGSTDAGTVATDAGSDGPTTLTWKSLGDAPRSRSVHFAYFFNDKLWVASGNHERGPIDDVFSWSPEGWRSFGKLPSDCPERKNAGVAVDSKRGTVSIFGGVWSGTPVGGEWTSRILTDGCTFDGQRFAAMTGTLPSGRSGLGMVFDDARDEAVLFGGYGTEALGDTWVLKAGVWTQKMPATSPSARYNVRLTYDAARQVVLLFGGHRLKSDGSVEVLDDTWTWDGTTWRDVSSGTRPPGRGYAAIAYDASTQKVVMGSGGLQGGGIARGSGMRDFWTWDGQSWSRLVSTLNPPGRAGASLTYDSVNRRLLLFGGNDGYDLSDFWALENGQWRELSHQPQPRSHFGLAQTESGAATLFGGMVVLVAAALNDTWRYEDGKWVRLALTQSPNPRAYPSLAMHDDTAVLFGGLVETGGPNGETWTLAPDGTKWVWRNLPGPPGRDSAAMAFDPVLRKTVLFGGRAADDRLDDTWLWDGSAWAKVDAATKPPARSGAKLVFHPVLKQLVLVGGGDGTNTLTDAWRFDGTTWHRIEGAMPGRILEQRFITPDGRHAVFGGFDGTNIRSDTTALIDGTWAAVQGGPSARLGGAFMKTSTGWRSLFGSHAVRDGSRWIDWSEHPDAWELQLVPTR